MKGIAIYVGQTLPGQEVSGRKVGQLDHGQIGVVNATGQDARNVSRAAFSVFRNGKCVILHIPLSDVEFRNYLWVPGPTMEC